MPTVNTIRRRALIGGTLLALVSCTDATAPIDTHDSRAPSVAILAPVSPELLVAVADADTRLLAVLDEDARAPMHAALTELHTALDVGDVERSRRAAAVVRALVAGHQSEHAMHNVVGVTAGDAATPVGSDGADLSALALLADAVDALVSVAR